MPPNFLTIIIFYYFCRYSYKLDKNMQKRKTYLSLVALLLTGWVSAQSNSVGINTDTPNESAALHISPLKGKAREAKITATIAKDMAILVLLKSSLQEVDLLHFTLGKELRLRLH